jgi:hypothetical protein
MSKGGVAKKGTKYMSKGGVIAKRKAMKKK